MNNQSFYNPAIHHRRSIRLPDYDYSQNGVYFITICVYHRECLFGAVVGARHAAPDASATTQLNEYGKIVEYVWREIPAHFPLIELGEFVVMPNHFHGILILDDPHGVRRAEPLREPQREQYGIPISGSIPTIVRSFKSEVTKQVNERRNTSGAPVWQRNYYEHIIRDEKSYAAIAEYIANNPAQWVQDLLFVR